MYFKQIEIDRMNAHWNVPEIAMKSHDHKVDCRRTPECIDPASSTCSARHHSASSQLHPQLIANYHHPRPSWTITGCPRSHDPL
jgi:hypothetical protein